MGITERTLRKWRKEALEGIGLHPMREVSDQLWKFLVTFQDRILQMTQELLDLHLMQKK